MQNMQMMPTQNPKKNSLWWILGILAVVIVVVVVVILVSNKKEETSSTPESNTNSNSGTNINSDTNSDVNTNTNTNPNIAANSFMMEIDKVTVQNGSEVYVTGVVRNFDIKVGDRVKVLGGEQPTKEAIVQSIQNSSGQIVNRASVGETVTILLPNVTKKDVIEHELLVDSVVNHITVVVLADFYVYTSEEGGRHTPFFDNYAPRARFYAEEYNHNNEQNRDIFDTKGTITLPADVEMVSPGENVQAKVTLENPMAVVIGEEFYLVEGGRKVAIGKVINVDYQLES